MESLTFDVAMQFAFSMKIFETPEQLSNDDGNVILPKPPRFHLVRDVTRRSQFLVMHG